MIDWKTKQIKLENINRKIDNPILPFAFQIYSKNKNGAQDMYKLLNKNNECPSGKIFWNKTYNGYSWCHLRFLKTVKCSGFNLE